MKIKLNYITLIVTMLVTGLSVNAQKFIVESMKIELDPLNSDGDRDYESLLQWANEAKEHPKTSNDPKMWYYRGLTYLKVAGLNNELTKANPDAIKTALRSFNKAIETDVKNRYTDDAKLMLLNVAIGLYNTGYSAYLAEDYTTAYSDFSLALPIMPYDKDGLLKQNNLTAEVLEQMMAFSAMNNGEKDKAISALQGLVDKGSLEINIYANLAKLHLDGGDTAKALEVVNKGREVNETDETLTNLKLNIYMAQGKSQELIDELDEAIESDPGNTIYYFARAMSYDGMGNEEKALTDYNTVLEIDPDYFDASYNIGVMYLNKVSKVVEELDGVYKPSIIEVKEAEIKGHYENAIVQFEKVFENNADIPLDEKVQLAETMKKIYARLENDEKYSEMKSFVESNKE